MEQAAGTAGTLILARKNDLSSLDRALLLLPLPSRNMLAGPTAAQVTACTARLVVDDPVTNRCTRMTQVRAGKMILEFRKIVVRGVDLRREDCLGQFLSRQTFLRVRSLGFTIKVYVNNI